MDAHERELIGRLGPATRPNVLELSRELCLARNTVQARIERLQSGGGVIGFGPVIALAALGYGVLAFTTLEIAQGAEASVIDGLTHIPEVLEVH
ncbi:MAG: AsnC family transcriptional regulator, partial [Actinomycetia bacterium]|nr:AsnC family transcriptional regulator [Actinomycetes bacterium]